MIRLRFLVVLLMVAGVLATFLAILPVYSPVQAAGVCYVPDKSGNPTFSGRVYIDNNNNGRYDAGDTIPTSAQVGHTRWDRTKSDWDSGGRNSFVTTPGSEVGVNSSNGCYTHGSNNQGEFYEYIINIPGYAVAEVQVIQCSNVCNFGGANLGNNPPWAHFWTKGDPEIDYRLRPLAPPTPLPTSSPTPAPTPTSPPVVPPPNVISAVGNCTQVTVQWSSTSGAVFYWLWVDGAHTFSLGGTSVVYTPPNGNSHFYQVSAVTGAGETAPGGGKSASLVSCPGPTPTPIPTATPTPKPTATPTPKPTASSTPKPTATPSATDTTPPVVDIPISLGSCYTPTTWAALQPVQATAIDTSGVASLFFRIGNGSADTGDRLASKVGVNLWALSITPPSFGNNFYLRAKAVDTKGNTSGYVQVGPFDYQAACGGSAWVQTQVGDVHSNQTINIPGGP